MSSSLKKLPEPKIHFLDFSYTELEKTFSGLGELYRLKQVCDWVFTHRAENFGQMTNLPLGFRNKVNDRYCLRNLNVDRQESSRLDSTIKFTFRTFKQQPFSAVFLPHSKYHTLCISTQVGCAWKCGFCASGLVPFERNLSSGEILDQLFLVEQKTNKKIQNILFMGMGEPLSNFDNTVKTIRWLTSEYGFRMSPRRITLSTTGVAPQIRKIAQERLQVNLALSLHAPTDELRKKIMPVSSKFLVQDILGACKEYQSKNNSDFTIEYILLKDVNDQLKHAEELARLIDSYRFRQRPKINLIPHNPVPSIPYQPSPPPQVRSFFDFLKNRSFIVHTRHPQGQDIDAACGQLL